jgi:hypothetical protein
MEHIIDVKSSYKTMNLWLKIGGYMSHEIDYSAHETHKKWCGHWKYPDWLWKNILDGRLYAINRFPNSYHLKSLKESGFEIVYQLPFNKEKCNFINKKLSQTIHFLTEDLSISSCYIISRKN